MLLGNSGLLQWDLSRFLGISRMPETWRTIKFTKIMGSGKVCHKKFASEVMKLNNRVKAVQHFSVIQVCSNGN